MTISNGMYTYTTPKSVTVTTVTETFYDEEGRVIKEVVTETRTEPQAYTYPYQPYIVGSGVTINTDTDTYKATFSSDTGD